jgi:hypothetical protein
VPLSGVQPLEPPEMPPHLVEELGRLLGQALAADIKQYPNLGRMEGFSGYDGRIHRDVTVAVRLGGPRRRPFRPDKRLIPAPSDRTRPET